MSAASSIPGQALTSSHRERLRELLATAVSFDEPLAPKTSMRVGGPAAAFAVVSDVPTLVATLDFCTAESIAWTMLGMGSNVLVNDAGFGGVVIRLAGAFAAIGRIP